MKSLQNYIQEAQTECLERLGAFFAFSNKQFNEKAEKGVEYVKLGGGTICPKANASQLIKELDEIYKKGVDQDVAENGIEAIIIRELYNHECFYTGDISDCVDKLEDYPTTEKQIREVYNKEYPNAEM